MLKKLFIVLIMLWGILSTASPYPQGKQSEGWGYQPVYSTSSPQTLSTSRPSSIPFRSTSAYLTPRSNASDGWPTSSIGPRKSTSVGGSLDEEEEDPIGVVPVPTPVGNALPLLAFAAAYILYQRKKEEEK